MDLANEPSLGYVIQEMYAWISSDETGEGVIAVSSPLGPMPLVGADLVRMEAWREHAVMAATMSGKTVLLVRFSTRTVLETINR